MAMRQYWSPNVGQASWPVAPNAQMTGQEACPTLGIGLREQYWAMRHNTPVHPSMQRRTFLQMAAALPAFAQNGRASAGVPWTQWGGPTRNFQTEAAGLKEQWPASG